MLHYCSPHISSRVSLNGSMFLESDLNWHSLLGWLEVAQLIMNLSEMRIHEFLFISTSNWKAVFTLSTLANYHILASQVFVLPWQESLFHLYSPIITIVDSSFTMVWCTIFQIYTFSFQRFLNDLLPYDSIYNRFLQGVHKKTLIFSFQKVQK